MKKVLFLFTMVCALALPSVARVNDSPQDDSLALRPYNKEIYTYPQAFSMRAVTFGIGRVNLLETYLSPRNYTGPELTFMFETLRPSRRWNQRMVRQMMWQLNLSSTKNTAKKGHELAGFLHWDMGWYYSWRPHKQWIFLAGGQFGINVGGIYNSRNSNNPAQAKAYTNVAASGMAIYLIRCRNYTMTARYQLDMPLMGLAFSPNYGQSYYELFSLGHYDRNICFTYPGNAPSWRQLLTLDLPLGNSIIRLGYLVDIRQSYLNGLKSHGWSQALTIGYVRRIQRLGAKKLRQQANPWF